MTTLIMKTLILATVISQTVLVLVMNAIIKTNLHKVVFKLIMRILSPHLAPRKSITYDLKIMTFQIL